MGKATQTKLVSREDAYEVWENKEAGWTWYVRKKYCSPEREEKDKYARWFCEVVSPITPSGELGDVYVRDIKNNAVRIK